MEETYTYSESELDVDEEALFDAEQVLRDEPEEALRIYATVADSALPGVRFEALLGLVLLHCRLQQHAVMHSCFSRMLELRSKVYPNTLSAAVSRVLEAATENVDLAISMHKLAASTLAMTKSKGLWFSCSIRLCKLFLEQRRFDDVHLLLAPLKHWCLDAAGEEDLSNKGAFLLEVIHIEALLCAESLSKGPEVAELRRRMLRVVKTVAVPDPRILGFVDELFGKQLLRSCEWDLAFDALHQAYNSYEEVGSDRRRACLKLLLCVSVVLFQTVHIFDRENRLTDVDDAPMLAQMRVALASGAPTPNDAIMDSLVAHALGKPFLTSRLFATRKRITQRLAYDHYWLILHHVVPDWLDVRSLMALDAATLNRACREYLSEFVSGWLPKTPLIRCPTFTATSTELAWLAAHKCPLLHLQLVQPFSEFTKDGVLSAEESLRSLRSFVCNLRVFREQTLVQLVAFCSGIIRLDMSNCSLAVTDPALIAIGANCHLLTDLVLYGCSDYTAIGMNAIAGTYTHCWLLSVSRVIVCVDGCPHLRCLNVGRSSVGDITIARALLQFSELEELQLFDSSVSDASLGLLSECCPRLVKLYMLGCKRITDEGLIALTETHPNLREISLSPRHTDTCLRLLVARCPNITFLRLSYMISDVGIRSIADKLPNLTFMDATASCASSEEQFVRLAERCVHLITLKLPSSISDGAIVRFVECCASLKTLHIGSSLPLTGPNLASRYADLVTDVAVTRIGEMCPHLESLELNGCNRITIASISDLVSQCQHLKHISLYGCVLLNSLVLSDIGIGCPELEYLNISGITNLRLDDFTLHRLHAHGRNLKSLVVDRRYSESMRFELVRMRTDDDALTILEG